jgi:hypothetical protein
LIYETDAEGTTIAEEIKLPDTRSKSEVHCQHLSVLTEQYFHVHEAEKFRAMVKDPEFKCQFCGRVVKSHESLCYAAEL